MDDDTNAAIGSILEAIEDIKSRIGALEDEARNAGDAAKQAADAVDEKIAAAVQPLASRLDHIETYLGSVLPAQILTGGVVSFSP